MDEMRTVIDFRKRKFVQVSRDVIDIDEKLTKPVEIAVYVVLCMYADNTSKDAYPSVATIAKKARCSESVARRALQTLEGAGYIAVRKRVDRRGFQTSNQYLLLDVDSPVKNDSLALSETTAPPCQF